MAPSPTEIVAASDGGLYGATAYGGGSSHCKNGCGTVFKVDKTGKETVFYAFQGNATGKVPIGGLAQDKDGNLYGTAHWDGFGNVGVAFKLNKAGHETILGMRSAARAMSATQPAPWGWTRKAICMVRRGLPLGPGGVWKISRANKETVLSPFTGGNHGGNPQGGVVLGKDGDLVWYRPCGTVPTVAVRRFE